MTRVALLRLVESGRTGAFSCLGGGLAAQPLGRGEAGDVADLGGDGVAKTQPIPGAVVSSRMEGWSGTGQGRCWA